MTEKETVTVAGVPVTVTAAAGVLAVTIGRPDPAAAGGLLRTDRVSGAAEVRVTVAGDTAARQPDQQWHACLYPGPPGAAADILLCDGCLTAATGLLAECADGCPQDLDHDGLCLRARPGECQWCGTPGRLHEVSRSAVIRLLPSLESGEGTWHLNWPDGRRGPYPSAQAAWDDWHARPPAPPGRSTPPASPSPPPAQPPRTGQR